MSKALHMILRVAVFESSPHNLRLFQEILVKKGFEVFSYLEEQAPLTRIEQVNPHLIILAHLDGYDPHELELVRHLREYPSTRATPIVICTTGVRGIAETGGLERLKHIYLVPKPFSVGTLLSAISTALND